MTWTPEQWQRIEHLFHEALELSDGDRTEYLADACRDEPEIRAEVEALLAADDGSTATSGPPPHPHSALLSQTKDAAEDLSGRRIGPYRIRHEIGRGGMGVVYLAERHDVGKLVALKLIRSGIASPEREARFLFERRLLARLQHPHIATFFDAGLAEGMPFCAMEYVDGTPITAFCERQELGVRARLELFTTVCEAVDYAHRNFIVHRDLKPSNILVTRDGRVKLLDFGIAKLLDDSDEAAGPALTHTGMHALTPEYAAPEQVRSETVTTATDVYALGVLLYELLTGRRPYRITSRAPSEVERIICHQVPQKPSTAVRSAGAAAGSRGSAAAAVDAHPASPTDEHVGRKLRGDLDNIVLKALRKEPERRYASADQFAADIRRYLAGRPITARKDTFVYRARKFIARNQAAVLAGATVVALIAVLVTFYTMRLSAENVRVQREAEKSEQIAGFLTDLFRSADPLDAGGRSTTVGEILDRGKSRVAEELSGQPELRVAMTGLIGEIYINMGEHAEAESLLVQSRELALEHFGAEHAEVAKWTHQLGRLRAIQGRYEEAERLVREGLRIRRKLLGEVHEDVGSSVDYLGQILNLVGRYDEAEAAFTEGRDIMRRVHGPDSGPAAIATHNLAGIYYALGEYARAESLYREALEIHREIKGDDHPTTLMGMNAVGLMLREQNRPADADSFLTRAYEAGQTALGPDHPTLNTFASNLALTRQDLGDYQRAEMLFRQVLAADRRAYGDEHGYVGQDLANIGFVLAAQGKRAEAEEVYADALRVLRDAYGPNHPRVASALVDAARFALDERRTREAAPMLREALEIRTERLGLDDLRTAETMMLLGRVLQDLGRMDEAAELYERAAAVFRADEGASLARLTSTLSRLRQVLLMIGRLDEAAAVLAECRSAFEAAEEVDASVECGEDARGG